jgi:hypothetical protein
MKHSPMEKLEIELIRALDALNKIIDESKTLENAKNEATKALQGIKNFDQYEKLEDL